MKGDYTPTYIGGTMLPESNPYEFTGATWSADVSGHVTVQGTISFHVDTRAFDQAMGRLDRALSRLRYPPREPARGRVSRRKEKLRKAGVRRR